ncbi:MAG: transketolase C-terminal domain-containing protein [Sandaracinaceae bacterium]
MDPRTLRPLDHEAIVRSVKKTNRCVVVHEHWPYGGPGAEIVDRVQREAFDYLDAPILRATNLDVPMPAKRLRGRRSSSPSGGARDHREGLLRRLIGETLHGEDHRLAQALPDDG